MHNMRKLNELNYMLKNIKLYLYFKKAFKIKNK